MFGKLHETLKFLHETLEKLHEKLNIYASSSIVCAIIRNICASSSIVCASILEIYASFKKVNVEVALPVKPLRLLA